METLNAIENRRSIRKFKDEKISDKQIEQIVRAGMYAPSAGNEQPWHFIIIKDKLLLKQIPKIHKYAKMMNSADIGIFVCYDPSCEKHESMAVQDCSAATQNMLLAIHDLGLGGCWIGVYPRKDRMKKLQDLFNIPDAIIPFSLIAVGVPDEIKNGVNRYKKDRIHYETW